MSRESFSYTHGDTGSKPSGSLDFQANQRPDSENFDWYWYNVIEAIKGHASEFNRLDSDNDGKVDNAEYADNAGQLDGNNASAFASAGHTHDARYYTESEADSNFASAGHSHDSRYIKESGDQMSGRLTLSDGSWAASRVWVNDHGDVPNADYADNAGDADTVDGNHAGDFANSGHNHDSRYITEWGDTLSGSLDFGSNSATSLHEVVFDNIESTSSTNGAIGYDASEGLLLHDGSSQRVVADGENLHGGNQISVSGGIGSGSAPITISVNEGGLDADTVDGNHAWEFADSGHNHDNRYYTESQADSRFALSGHSHDAYARLKDGVQAPVFGSTNDVPNGIGKGEVVYIDGDGLYMEDGN